MRASPSCLWFLACCSLVLRLGAAQQAEPVIDDELLEARITQACAGLRAANQLVPCSKLVAEAAAARTFAMPAAAPRAEVLGPERVCALVRPSLRIVGHYYLCTECDAWHFDGASGFCVDAAGAVATCAHVLAADDTMREAYLVVADLQGGVWPVERVLAHDAGADVCVVKTAETGAVPLPLRAGVRAGERVYCLSNPDHQFGFFSEGLVARWYAQRDPVPEGTPAKPPDQVAPRTWLHVTCDFAKGSSGAPIVDPTGTVIGIAQSTTTVVYDEDAALVDTQMVFKTATPAAALAALLPAKDGAAAAAEPKHDTFTIASRAVAEQRRINVWTPGAYASAAERFPVLYMPDGGTAEDFPHIVETIAALIAARAISPMLVVGIENTERRRDLTGPTEVASDKTIAARVGGSAAFRTFVRDELIPEIERRYRCTGARAIVGESLAGLFVVETLLLEPHLFGGYIAISPSLWWNDHALVKNAAQHLAAAAGKDLRLFLTAADEDNIVPHVAELARLLGLHAPKTLTWVHEPMPAEHHDTIFKAAKATAFRAVLGP